MYVGVRVRGGVGIPGGRFPHALRVCVWPSEPMEAESRALRPSVGREPSPRGPSPTRAGPCLFDCAQLLQRNASGNGAVEAGTESNTVHKSSWRCVARPDVGFSCNGVHGKGLLILKKKKKTNLPPSPHITVLHVQRCTGSGSDL